MSATFRAAGASATGTTSVTLSQPAGTANGDVLLAFVVDHATTGTSAAPTGWTNQVNVSDANGRFQCFSAVVSAGSLTGTSWSFTGLTTTAIGIIVGFTGADNVTPLVGSSARNNASGTTGTTSITPSAGGDDMIVAGFCSYANGATWSAEAVATNPVTITERSDNANGTACSLAVCTGGQVGVAAATGASSATMSANAANGAILIALTSVNTFKFGADQPVSPATLADHSLNFSADYSGLIITPLLSYNFITNAPVWGGWTMDDGEKGQPYREQWYLEGCSTPVTFSVVSGSLPPGLTLSSIAPALGQIAGTPTTLGTYSFTLRASNIFGQSDQSFSITINSVTGAGGSYAFA